ncbi:MAG: cobalamin biosynthesis protein [Idiomarinaceae bacterium]|uniref:cobalamin biosynthesis protein CobD/CbiB n=1 Tax=Idiomarina sp. 28-8 TaxID=1260624 RepID=UPI0002EA1492|nr:cobalamin biosynthesis protein [Idiomarina sp. 28-8]NWO01614.1 cobalamin biosynthesis protein [Idiomarinaceae bacterium]
MNTELLTDILLSPVALALLALLAERWFPWPEQWHPFAVLRLMAAYMSGKVNKPKRPVGQQRLAGFLAWLTMSLLVLLPAAIVFAGAEVSLAIGWLILLVSLRQQPVSHAIKLADSHLQRGRKNAARAWLSRITWRDCDLLSEHGIAKTSIELRATSILEHRFTPLLFWFVGGPLAALGVRTLSELTQVWPVAQAKYRHFGLATHWLHTITHFLPSFLLALTARFMALFQRNKFRLQPLKRNPLFSTILLSWIQSFSYCHRVSLGGPIQVQGIRIARQRFEGRPAELLIPRAPRWQRQWQGFFIACLVIALFALFIYRP